MARQERLATLGLVLGAAAVAMLWPLSAYALTPLALPALIGLMLAALLIVRRPEYGLALVISLTPLINAALPQAGSGDISVPIKPFQLLVPALAGAILVYALLVRRNEKASGSHERAIGMAVLLFTVSTVLSSALSLEPSAAVSKVALAVTAAIVFFTVRLTCQTQSRLMVVVGGGLAALLVASVQGVASEALGVYSSQGFVSNSDVVGRVEASFAHPNLYGAFLAFLMPLAAAIGVNSRFPTGLRWLALTALTVAIPALVFSYARGAIAALLVGGAIWLALMRPRTAIVAALVVAVLAVTLAPATLKSRFENDSSNDVSLRGDIWESAVEIYSTQPLIGVGPQNFQTAYERLPSTTTAASQRRLLHNDQLLVPPHAQSIYLQALAEQGLLGLLTMLGVLVGGLVTAHRASRALEPRTKAVGIGVGIGLLSVAIDGFLEIVFFSETMVAMFGLLAVTAILVDRNRERRHAERPTVSLSPATP